MEPSKRTAIIIGAGPAGLTAAYELLCSTDIKPIVYEADETVGGLARTVNFKGNRIDIGGHRFFSKSDRVMNWWLRILPLQAMEASRSEEIGYQGEKRFIDIPRAGPNPEHEDRVMLLRKRKSRIYFLQKFFDYPLTLNAQTIMNLGLQRMVKIALSYGRSVFFPVRNEKNLEDFFINRFGRELYETFFKEYTEKVWGARCDQISAEWGRQRIKGLSIGKAITHFFKKGKETSLIEQFLYPKYGPGQMWEEVARIVRARGGQIHVGHRVEGIAADGNKVSHVFVKNRKSEKVFTQQGDYFFSTMPVRELVLGFGVHAPTEAQRVALGLMYRDFIIVGLLLEKLKVEGCSDNWIYIQEPDVKMGRLQIFNNWSPYMVGNPKHSWLGLEYFCNEGDELWSKSDRDLISFAIDELSYIKLIDKEDVRDQVVIRVPKAYPAYFGTYNQFSVIQEFLDGFENLFLIGRNGMHRYNNQDHSMLAAMTAVENIKNGIKTKDNIWRVNTEEKYHEEKNI